MQPLQPGSLAHANTHIHVHTNRHSMITFSLSAEPHPTIYFFCSSISLTFSFINTLFFAAKYIFKYTRYHAVSFTVIILYT
jgi:hypothetical protein